jgi:Tol biopolymer transport system component
MFVLGPRGAKRQSLAFVLSIVILVGAIPNALLIQPVCATFPGNNGKIAFSSSRAVGAAVTGNYEIYTMNPDGSNVTDLTNNPAYDASPKWSPDGKKIVFASNRDDPKSEIYVMNADGSGVTRLTNSPEEDSGPTWSPDGNKIAFVSNRTGNYEIYTMNADGSALQDITNNPAVDTSVSWGSNNRILFIRYSNNYDIYVMNPDGSGQTKLTDNPLNDFAPDWSPDATKIVFHGSMKDWVNNEIYVMNADGSGRRRMTSNPGWDGWAKWSPDGTRIVFQSDRDGGNWEIYSMNVADGSVVTRLTTWTWGANGEVDWQPLPTTPATTTAASAEEQGNYVTRSELYLYLGVLAAVLVALILMSRKGAGKASSRVSASATTAPRPQSVPSTPTVPLGIAQPPTPTKHCMECGSQIPDAAKFCTICGASQPR